MVEMTSQGVLMTKPIACTVLFAHAFVYWLGLMLFRYFQERDRKKYIEWNKEGNPLNLLHSIPYFISSLAVTFFSLALLIFIVLDSYWFIKILFFYDGCL